MTIPLGLTPKQWDRLNYLLRSHHRIQIRLQLLDLSHKYLNDLSPRLLSGQVNIDANAEEYTRSLSLEILDHKQELMLDGDAPEDASLYYNRMIRVIYTVISPDGSERFPIPIFCGPLSKVVRNGVVLSIDAVGKEKLGMSAVWKTRKYGKGLKKEFVIKNILTEIGGEASKKIDIVNRKGNPRMGDDALTVNRNTTAVKAAKKVSRSMGGAQLFYDGRGVARVRDVPSSASHVFTDRKDLLSFPQVSYDAESVINAVDVTGATKGKGKHKHTIHYRAVAPRKHALSPWNMGRNGTPRYIPEFIEDSNIKTKKAARAYARKRLKHALLEAVDVQFDCLPVPYLEERDLCKVDSKRWSGMFRLTKMTIPLTADGVSTIGYLKQVTPKVKRSRKKNTSKNRRKRAA